MAFLSLSRPLHSLGETSSLAELQLKEALLAMAEVMLSPWKAISAALDRPGGTMTGGVMVDEVAAAVGAAVTHVEEALVDGVLEGLLDERADVRVDRVHLDDAD